MSYLLFILCGYALTIFSAKIGTTIDDVTWLCIAILSGAEVISWRWKR